jgi:hypothetical protein
LKTKLAIVAFLVFCASPPVLAGPPLSIDDPGVLDAWHWEIIGAMTLTSGSDGDYWQAPVLDISLGVIEDYVQVGFVYPYAHADSGNGKTQSDFGNAEFGVKWRFLKRERIQMAFAPYHSFGVSTRTASKGIGGDNDATVLPINAEYRVNDLWSLNGEVRYVSIDNLSNEWGYGAAVAYAPNNRWTLLAEVAGASDTDFKDDLLELRAGFDAALNDSLHLLFSIATGIKEPSGAGKLDYDIFLGLQFFP